MVYYNYVRAYLVFLFLGMVQIPSSMYAAETTQENLFSLEPICNESPLLKKKKKRKPCCAPSISSFFSRIGADVFELNRNLFTWDSFKIITITFPFFIGTRMIDDKLQRCFYNRQNHKNVTQLPGWCHDVAQWSLGIPIVLLGMNAFFAEDDDLRITSQIFLIGMPFVIWTKDLIKHLKFDACLRPWNEHFSRKKRSLGGFPSGHMAEATYMAVLFGMRFGPRFAVPLGALAAFIGVIFVNCNRHYISQLVAGAGFGAMYALAANKLIDKRLQEYRDFTCNVVMNESGPACQINYRF